jgi:hypothetical protein
MIQANCSMNDAFNNVSLYGLTAYVPVIEAELSKLAIRVKESGSMTSDEIYLFDNSKNELLHPGTDVSSQSDNHNFNEVQSVPPGNAPTTRVAFFENILLLGMSLAFLVSAIVTLIYINIIKGNISVGKHMVDELDT